jgi:hypothetical protein
MIKYFVDLLKRMWTTRQGLLSNFIALLIVYTGASLFTGELRNPILLVLWALIGSLSTALVGAIYLKYKNS